MSTVITKNNRERVATEPSAPRDEETPESVARPESREEFYAGFREALKAHLKGDSKAFHAYMSDHRIKPPPSTLSLPPRPATEVGGAERALSAHQALDEARFSVVSLLASVRAMVGVLGKLVG